jgi:hypothetical protein
MIHIRCNLRRAPEKISYTVHCEARALAVLDLSICSLPVLAYILRDEVLGKLLRWQGSTREMLGASLGISKHGVGDSKESVQGLKASVFGILIIHLELWRQVDFFTPCGAEVHLEAGIIG